MFTWYKITSLKLYRKFVGKAWKSMERQGKAWKGKERQRKVASSTAYCLWCVER